MKQFVTKIRRPRNFNYIIAILSSLALFTICDPNANLITSLPFGAGTVSMLALLLRAFIAVFGLLICRKWMLDYEVANFEELGISAVEEGNAGMYAIAISIQVLAIAIIIAAVIVVSL